MPTKTEWYNTLPESILKHDYLDRYVTPNGIARFNTLYELARRFGWSRFRSLRFAMVNRLQRVRIGNVII